MSEEIKNTENTTDNTAEIETENTTDSKIIEDSSETKQNVQIEINAEDSEDVEDVAEKISKGTKSKKPKKEKKIRNQALLKKGSYSVGITALVIAGIIVINVLFGALANRFVLDYDFSTEKKNSITKENIEYLKKIDDKVDVIVCASEDDYSNYMSYFAQQYSVTSSDTDYYDQTLTLVKKYADYNKNINLKFVDYYSSEFSEITSTYGSNIAYGDIIVSATKNKNLRSKTVGFTDIYELTEDSTYAAYYGQSVYTVGGNNIENALTGAISYVISDKTVKVAFLSGHSTYDTTQSQYRELLKSNNYEIVDVDDKLIKSIPDDCASVVIPAPETDFLPEELEVLSSFLDNDSKLGKGIIVFANENAPMLSNFYDFLDDWGITVEDGIVFETNDQNHLTDNPYALGSYVTEDAENLEANQVCVTSQNVPLSASFETRGSITVKSLVATPETTVIAPKGSDNDFAGADSLEQKSYSTAIMSQKNDYDDDNNEIVSYVTVLSSTDFLSSDYNNYDSFYNKDMLLAISDTASGVDTRDITFVTKSITDESFLDSVTESSSNAITLIFMILLPLAVIVIGIVVFIKRRNA